MGIVCLLSSLCWAMSFEHSPGMVEVKGGDFGREYSLLAVLSVECTVSIVRQLLMVFFLCNHYYLQLLLNLVIFNISCPIIDTFVHPCGFCIWICGETHKFGKKILWDGNLSKFFENLYWRWRETFLLSELYGSLLLLFQGSHQLWCAVVSWGYQ